MPTALPDNTESKAPSATQWPSRVRPVAHAKELRELRALRHADAERPRAHGTDYVTIPVAAAMTGYSAKAIRRKIEAGVWLEGREFRRAPDGHVLISVKGYESWVERGRG